MRKGNTYFAQSVKQLRKTLGLSQEEFGKRIGVAKTTICNYEQGVSTPARSTLENMSSEFHITPSYFIKDPTEFEKKETQRIYGSVIPLYKSDDIKSLTGSSPLHIVRSISLPLPSVYSNDTCIATEVPDNSMNKLGIRIGSYIIIDKDTPLLDNDIIAVIYKGKLSIRRYHDTAYGKYITTESTKMPSAMAKESLPKDNVEIIGKVIHMIMDSRYM